jgi:hypothetical protein
VLVCLTYADSLYVECIEENGTEANPEPTDDVKRKIRMDLYVSNSACQMHSKG